MADFTKYIKSEQQENATQQERKSWNQMDNAEKKESFDKYMKYKLFEAHKTAKADWQKDMSKEEVDRTIPYNAKTGATYSRETSMLLRAEMAIKGYDKPQFVTMEQGNAMGGILKLKHDEKTGEILTTKNGLQARVDGVKMLYIADHEIRPKYHGSQFDGLDESKIKERDLTTIQHYREQAKNQDFEVKIDYNKTLGISGILEKQLNNLTLAQIKGVDYFNPAKKIDMTKEKAQTKEQNKGMER